MMGSKRNKKNKQNNEQYERVDIYLIPKEQVEMYRVLRETLAEEVIEWMEQHFDNVHRSHDEEQGEYVAGTSDRGERRYYLNPTNVSKGQHARDKEQLELYLEREMLQ